MKELFSIFNINLTREQIEKFNEFALILEENNKIFNLTSIKEGKETLIKHFLDSSIGVDIFKHNSTIIEIGSGGGFPSVPLMILRDDLKFTLVEATEKKCKYLEKVKLSLGLNCKIINERAEVLGKNDLYRHLFDYSTARAVARLNVLCEYCLPFLKVGGSFIAYKGESNEEVSEAENAIKILGGKLDYVKKYTLPEGCGNRSIIKIDKINLTPVVYPRGNGKERKKPL